MQVNKANKLKRYEEVGRSTAQMQRNLHINKNKTKKNIESSSMQVIPFKKKKDQAK